MNIKQIIKSAENINSMKQIIKWWKKLGNSEKISFCAEYFPYKDYKQLNNEDIQCIYNMEMY